MTHWQKIGLIWQTPPRHDWMVSHASLPVAEIRGNGLVRVYFSCRDANNISSIAWFECNIDNPGHTLAVSNEPVVSPGPLGTFDDSGASLGCMVNVGSKRYLYYMGWNLGVTVPWRNSIGLAISNGPDEPFQKHSLAPVFDRNPIDPYTLSYPWVLHDAESDLWRMWYGSNLRWGSSKSDMDHVIKYAESRDGIHWEPSGHICIGAKSPEEYAFARPCVVAENGQFRMWYAYRGECYKIGYAESTDGVHWTRKDESAGIEASGDGWDSEMMCYPSVFEHRGKKYLLYNGNEYGKTGIGLAIARD